MSEDIRIVIEDDAEGASKHRSIDEIDRFADEKFAAAARFQNEAARIRALSARDRVGAAQMTAHSEALAAQSQYRGAAEMGDIDAQTAAQARMAEIEARRVRLQEHAEALERLPVVQHADPVEVVCAGRSEPTARWLREHRDWVVNPQKNAKLTAAHYDAVGDGLEPDSSEYFQYVERKIGLDGGSRSGDRSGARLPTNYDRANPNTHVLRGGKEVVLTRGEYDRATDGTLVWNYGPNKGKPIGAAEAARRKAEMVREGRYNRLD